MSDSTASITTHNGKTSELPVLSGTHGPDVLDVRGLLYRGYPIEQLAEHSSYLEVCHLLMYGELPNSQEAEAFNTTIQQHTMVHENIRDFINGFRYDAHPMAMLVGTIGALSSFYHDSLDITNPEHREISAHRLIAKMPTIASYCYNHSRGLPFMYPDNKLSYVENFTRLMFAVPAEEFAPNPVAVKALELIMILHADHEQNASTSTVRLAGSSGANPFASIAAGVASLWGPAHGGANEACVNMLDAIVNSGETIEKTIARAKDKNDPFRLMGFVARKLEEATLADEYFIERKLYPNVDFYSGIIFRALNIPMNMFTVMFAMSRTVGWISHWMEMHEDPEGRIGRPRQIYTGHAKRDYPT